MICSDPTHVPNSAGNGCVLKSRAYSIAITENGRTVRIPQPIHIVAHSKFDPTGLVWSLCKHGLEQHPDPEIAAGRRLGFSWIRSKHLDQWGKCPECRGEPRPADLTTPRG